MSASEALRPLLHLSQRLVLEQFIPTNSLWFLPSTTLRRMPFSSATPRRPPICLRCSFHSRLRLYSTYQSSNRQSSSNNASSDPHTTEPAGSKTPELPSAAESRRSPLSARFSTFMDNLQSRVLVASQTINGLTGYSAIEAIKAQNATLETSLATAQSTLRAARQAYKETTSRRASTQREVTTLLARKDTWSPGDLERFTALYRLDHELESSVAQASAALTEAESEESRLGAALNAGILKRYHEEQVWSDRIRRQSTWGTWGLMGVNVLLFLVLQFVAEPWKRGRLMRGVAEAEKGVLEEVRREIGGVREALALRKAERTDTAGVGAGEVRSGSGAGEAEDSVPVQTASGPWKETFLDPGQWRPALIDLYSERRICLRMRDASLIALEGAVVGAAAMAGVAAFILRRA